LASVAQSLLMSPADVCAQFGARVRALRIVKGWSQEQLADAAALHRTYVGSLERGERNVSLKNIYRLADALEVDVQSLFAMPS
jgi:transcriptional regulator with XRE-family HTH domain